MRVIGDMPDRLIGQSVHVIFRVMLCAVNIDIDTIPGVAWCRERLVKDVMEGDLFDCLGAISGITKDRRVTPITLPSNASFQVILVHKVFDVRVMDTHPPEAVNGVERESIAWCFAASSY